MNVDELMDYFVEQTFTKDAHDLAVKIADYIKDADVRNGELIGALATVMATQFAQMPDSPDDLARRAYLECVYNVISVASTQAAGNTSDASQSN